MAAVDYYQHMSVDFDDDGLPMWGSSGCLDCDGYGWTTAPGEHEDYSSEVTRVDCCCCCLPTTEEDEDRLLERLRIVAAQLAKSVPGEFDFVASQDQDLH